jgi:hypothetical protein
VELYLHSPNTPSWRGAQLKHRDNFTFTQTKTVTLTHRIFLVVPSSTLKMEATRSSETLLSKHHTTQHNNPENHDLYLHRRENLEFLNIKIVPKVSQLNHS